VPGGLPSTTSLTNALRSQAFPMPIKFLCPNGHQLNAPDNLAGKPGKCPKCHTPFVVPKPDEQPEAAAEAGDVGSPPAEALPETEKPVPAETIGQGSGKGKLSPSDLFIFLCPNGHKLNGPPSLRGKLGQCPHCGAK